MNRLENWFCSTNFWRSVTRDHLLPRMLDGAGLNGAEPRAHVLELGAGCGAATSELRRRFPRVTSLEYGATFAAQIACTSRDDNCSGASAPEDLHGAARTASHLPQSAEGAAQGLARPAWSAKHVPQVAEHIAHVVQGDAAQLPFADESFTCVIAILMLHHLRSRELQDCAFVEVWRVLRPGGIFVVFEIHDGWLQRLIHMRSTFVPVKASGAHAHLNAAGFARVSVDFLRGGFVLRAQRAAD
jgi:SAM-dependent methyltransferase